MIEYIQAHITEKLDYALLAAMMNLSVYEFRRIFAFAVGCPLSEYVRKRRLSPAGRWACFKLNTVDDGAVNEIYSKILYEWLPSANLRKNGKLPTVEVYPMDMEQEGFEWEIRIPIEQEK